jgi:hypothetical protein
VGDSTRSLLVFEVLAELDPLFSFFDSSVLKIRDFANDLVTMPKIDDSSLA